MGNLRNVVYLEEAQLEELRINGTITVDGVTIDYNDNDMYVTPLDDFDGVYAKVSDFQVVSESVTTLQNTVNGHTSSISSLNTSVTNFGESIVELQETITTISETQDLHAEAIEEIQEMQGLVVQGKAVFTEANQDNHILNITIPGDIVKKLSTPFAAKVKIICLEQEMSAFDGVVSGTVDLANTPAAMMNSAYVGELVGTTGSGYVDIENPNGVIIDLSNAGITISAGYHYFYKIEFIC